MASARRTAIKTARSLEELTDQLAAVATMCAEISEQLAGVAETQAMILELLEKKPAAKRPSQSSG